MHERLAETLRAGAGIVVAREHPHLAWPLRAAREKGEIVAVWPGIYAAAADAHSFPIRVLALLTADPDAILVGPSAEIALGWRTAEPGEVVHASSRCLQTAQPGFQLARRRLDPDDLAVWADDGRATPASMTVHLTSPAVTAIDLARERGSDAIDNALRHGVSLADLQAVLDRRRLPGNAELRRILRDSRDEPWSAAERTGQRALRAAGFSGWSSNRAVARAPGKLAYLDVAFDHLLLAIEIDGHAHHGTRAAFHSDRARDLDLALLGWQVVRISAAWVLEHPDEFAAAVRTLAQIRATLLGVTLIGVTPGA